MFYQPPAFYTKNIDYVLTANDTQRVSWCKLKTYQSLGGSSILYISSSPKSANTHRNSPHILSPRTDTMMLHASGGSLDTNSIYEAGRVQIRQKGLCTSFSIWNKAYSPCNLYQVAQFISPFKNHFQRICTQQFCNITHDVSSEFTLRVNI